MPSSEKETSSQCKVKAPWGHYKVILHEDEWKVKILHVNRGHRISLQYHNYRDEVWYVLKGAGKFYRETDHVPLEVTKVGVGDCCFVERGRLHRIEGNGRKGITIVEVQRGSPPSEEDIVRAEDDYGRVS